MNKIIAVAAATSLMSLAACGQEPEEAQADIAEQQVEAQEDIMEERADLQESMGNEGAADAMDDQADAMGEMREDDAMAEEMPVE